MAVAVAMSSAVGAVPSVLEAFMMTDTPPWMSSPWVILSPTGVKPITHTTSTTQRITRVEAQRRTVGFILRLRVFLARTLDLPRRPPLGEAPSEDFHRSRPASSDLLFLSAMCRYLLYGGHAPAHKRVKL